MHEEDLNVVAVGDSLKNYRQDFDMWMDVFAVEKQIGISPIRYKTFDTGRVVFNIEPLKYRRNWLVSFDGKRKFSMRFMQSHVIKSGDSLLVRFYYNRNTQLTEIGQMVIHP